MVAGAKGLEGESGHNVRIIVRINGIVISSLQQTEINKMHLTAYRKWCILTV
jgi:hypothetical protein